MRCGDGGRAFWGNGKAATPLCCFWELCYLAFWSGIGVVYRWKRDQANMTRNRGELAEGWYDPSTLQKAQQSAVEDGRGAIPRSPVKSTNISPRATRQQMEEESSSDDEVGPALPGKVSRSRRRVGPAIPGFQDLELKRGILLVFLYFGWI
jgi:hypothetical protein